MRNWIWEISYLKCDALSFHALKAWNAARRLNAPALCNKMEGKPRDKKPLIHSLLILSDPPPRAGNHIQLAPFDAFWDWHFLRVETLVLTPPWDSAAWTLLPCHSLWPLTQKFLSPPVTVLSLPLWFPCPTSDNICTLSTTPSIPSLCLFLCIAKSRLWAAEYEQNNSSLSGDLTSAGRGLRSWDPVNIWTWLPFCVRF